MKSDESAFCFGNQVQVLQSGSPYFSRFIEEIDAATECIHLQVYIWANDYTGNLVKQALLRAAGRNVSIYIVVDGFGSKDLPDNFFQECEMAGIHFRFFAPAFSGKNISLGRRLHHKVMVCDKKIALVGGINIADKYNKVKETVPWLDYSLRVEGPVCFKLHERCAYFWRKKIPEEKAGAIPETSEHGTPVKVNINDFLRKQTAITQSYKTAIGQADKRIIIAGSYFIQGRRIRKLLAQAVKRGVRVQLILTRYSDVRLAASASRYLYNWLLKNHIEIYEWKHSVLHAKAAVIDEYWLTIGSHNLNFLSDYESIELNLEVLDASIAEPFCEEMEEIMHTHCEQITFEQYARLPYMYALTHKASYYLLRYIWRFFYMFRRTGKHFEEV